MPKRHHHPYAAGGTSGWSVGSNSLTAAGQSELRKDLGRQLQKAYRNVLKEPAPDRIKQLLERLESRRHDEEGDNL
jgi:Anti-sigma factor NepR